MEREEDVRVLEVGNRKGVDGSRGKEKYFNESGRGILTVRM